MPPNTPADGEPSKHLASHSQWNGNSGPHAEPPDPLQRGIARVLNVFNDQGRACAHRVRQHGVVDVEQIIRVQAVGPGNVLFL
jgi:hypothetical protein